MNDQFPKIETFECKNDNEKQEEEASKTRNMFDQEYSEFGDFVNEPIEINEDTNVNFIGVSEIKPEIIESSHFEFIGIKEDDPLNMPEKCESNIELDSNKPIGCPSCEVRFVSKWNMKQHFESVHIIEPLECKWCAKTFNGTRNLKRHITSVHDKKKLDISQTKFACNICEKLFKDKRILVRHIDAVHEKKKPFKVDNIQEFNFRLLFFYTSFANIFEGIVY